MCKSRQSISPIRTLLFVCLLATVPGLARAQATLQSAPSAPALPAQWTDPVHTLANRIANLVGASKTISLHVRNISPISSSDAEAIRAALAGDLTQHSLRVEPESSADAHATVTFSEDLGSYVWVAQVRNGDAQQLAMIRAPKLDRTSGLNDSDVLTLEGKLVWRQLAKFLDFAVVTTAGPDSTLIVLEPDRLAYYHANDLTSWQFSQSVPISHSGAWLREARDPHGFIDATNGTARLQGVTCSQVLDPHATRCDLQDQKPGPEAQRIIIPGHEEDETILLDQHCGEDSVVLSTGNGDWTQPDSIQGYLLSELRGAVPSGAPFQAAGPVVSLIDGAGKGSARAVVHNLKTDEYEAYVFTPSCGH